MDFGQPCFTIEVKQPFAIVELENCIIWSTQEKLDGEKGVKYGHITLYINMDFSKKIKHSGKPQEIFIEICYL